MSKNKLQSDGYADGYKISNDGYASSDGYGTAYDCQLNVRLNQEDLKDITWINEFFFEESANNSMLCRILIRKGIQWYKNLSK